jgi:deoxyribonuclease V
MNLKKKLAEAQRRLSSRLILKWDGREVNLMAGADFGYSYKEKKIGASVVVFKIPELEIVEVSEAVREIEVPYLPGFLAYREGPAFLDAVDGNGIAHPRKMGLASYVGVVLDICTIGCAKKPFYPFVLPSEQKGSYTLFKDERKDDAGICLRSRSGVKPIFVSPGHRIDFISAMKLVLGCSKFRIPEPLREAHKRASKIF